MLLLELVSIQRALANGTLLDAIPKSSYNPSTTFIPSRGSVWVNGLWLTSLVLSLSTALIAVFVKQWLHHYTALPSGTSRERSHTRQFRHAGFQKWQVFAIVGLLPVTMHAALAIFFLGLVNFLVPFQVSLSWIVGSITAFVYVAYMISVFLPIFFCQCPYRTPLSNVAYTLYHLLRFRVRIFEEMVAEACCDFEGNRGSCCEGSFRRTLSGCAALASIRDLRPRHSRHGHTVYWRSANVVQAEGGPGLPRCR